MLWRHHGADDCLDWGAVMKHPKIEGRNNEGAGMFSFKLRRQKYVSQSLNELAESYATLRDSTGEGYSTFPAVTVYKKGNKIGRFSYNARFWPSATEKP